MLGLGMVPAVVQGDLAKVELNSRVVSASVLRQGLALVVREVRVPAGRGKYKLDALPDALDGSFWYGSPDGVTVDDVVTKLRYVERTASSAPTITDLLAANVGKRIHFFVSVSRGTNQEPRLQEYRAVLSSFTPPNTLTFKTDDGYLFYPPGSIVKLDTNGLKTKAGSVPVEEIDFTSDAKHPGRIDFATLENDAAWTGSYLVSLDSPSSASVVSKAQLALGGIKFDNTDVQVVTGSPTLPEIVKFDLASGFGSLNAYLKNNQEAYRRYRNVNRDPYTYLATYFNQGYGAQSAYITYDPYLGGGFGGGGSGNIVIANADDAQVYSQAPRQETPSIQVEDLFGFPLGHVSLEPGDRLTRVMFRTDASYKRLYRWMLTHPVNNPYRQPEKPVNQVDKIIKLANTSGKPWPTGAAMVVENNVPLGQVPMRFTSAGKSAELVLGTVNDIPTSESVKEISRARTEVRSTVLTAVSSEATLTVENTRKEDLPFEISYQLSGQVTDAGGGQLEQLSAMLNGFNPESLITWNFVLKPGESRTFVVKFITNV